MSFNFIGLALINLHISNLWLFIATEYLRFKLNTQDYSLSLPTIGQQVWTCISNVILGGPLGLLQDYSFKKLTNACIQ
jgi:hypothetical protein